MSSIRVQDTVSTTRPVVTVDADASLAEAVKRMRQHAIHHLVVIQEAEVCGIVGDRDIYARGLTSDGAKVLSDLRVRDIMTPLKTSLSEQSDLREALDLMRTHGVSALPLVENGNLIGIVTETDLFRILDQALSADEEPTPGERAELMMANPVVQSVMNTLAQAGI